MSADAALAVIAITAVFSTVALVVSIRNLNADWQESVRQRRRAEEIAARWDAQMDANRTLREMAERSGSGVRLIDYGYRDRQSED